MGYNVALLGGIMSAVAPARLNRFIYDEAGVAVAFGTTRQISSNS